MYNCWWNAERHSHELTNEHYGAEASRSHLVKKLSSFVCHGNSLPFAQKQPPCQCPQLQYSSPLPPRLFLEDTYLYYPASTSWFSTLYLSFRFRQQNPTLINTWPFIPNNVSIVIWTSRHWTWATVIYIWAFLYVASLLLPGKLRISSHFKPIPPPPRKWVQMLLIAGPFYLNWSVI
jgi:hypothetical protein